MKIGLKQIDVLKFNVSYFDPLWITVGEHQEKSREKMTFFRQNSPIRLNTVFFE